VSEIQENVANPMLCPSCQQELKVAVNQADVVCACGFTAFGPYVSEVNYLRAGLPVWQARLAELEDAVSRGLRPDGSNITLTQTAPNAPLGAYQYLVGGGAILLFAGLMAFVGIMWRYLGTVGQGAVLVAVTVILGVLSNQLATRIQSTATALSVLTVGSWLIDAGWIINHVLTRWDPASRVVTTMIMPAVLSALTAVVFIYVGKKLTNTIWENVGHLFLPVSVGLILTSVELNIAESTEVTSFYWAALALPLSVSILLLLDNSTSAQRVFAGTSRTVALLVLALFTSGFVAASLQADKRAALAWALHLVLLAVYSAILPRVRGLSVVLVAAAAALSAGFVDFPIAVRVAFPALFAVVSLRTGKDSKVQPVSIISATSGAWLVLGLAQANESVVLPFAIGLSVLTGLVAMAHAWMTKRSELVPFGAAFLALSIIFSNSNSDVTELEAFTLPIAAVLLVSGMLAQRINSTLSSLLWLGPSCAVAVVPSALRAAESLDYSTRFTLSLCAALVLLVAGALLRYVGMLATGLAAVVILSRLPLAMLFSAVQPWISFTVSGVLLLVLGARFEYLRTRAGMAKAWIAGSLR